MFNSFLFAPALLRTHLFVFFAVHKTRKIFLSIFISKRSTVCTKHDQHRSQSIHLSDMRTVGVYHVCHDIWCHDSYLSFFLANIESQRTLSVRYFTTLSQQMLTAVRHVADANFCIQQDSALAKDLNCMRANSQLHFFQQWPLT